MDELHAAIGRAQLKKLPGIVAGRRRFVELLKNRGLEELKTISFPDALPGTVNSYWWLRLNVNLKALNCTREEFFAAMAAEGVPAASNYKAALPSTFPWFKDRQNKYPWNNPLCQGDPCREFPIPNAMQAMEDNFLVYILESWEEEEADMLMNAWRKLDAAFAK
jgi:dTDP-4-amino-4,6-dideoxygalactose transaminase